MDTEFINNVKSNTTYMAKNAKTFVSGFFEHVASQPSIFLITLRTLFLGLLLFTFVGGFIFVDIPLGNAIWSFLQTAIGTSFDQWQKTNGQDGQMILISAIGTLAIGFVWGVFTMFQKKK